MCNAAQCWTELEKRHPHSGAAGLNVDRNRDNVRQVRSTIDRCIAWSLSLLTSSFVVNDTYLLVLPLFLYPPQLSIPFFLPHSFLLTLHFTLPHFFLLHIRILLPFIESVHLSISASPSFSPSDFPPLPFTPLHSPLFLYIPFVFTILPHPFYLFFLSLSFCFPPPTIPT